MGDPGLPKVPNREFSSMNNLKMRARRAVRSGAETSDVRRVLFAAVRLALFHEGRIDLAREKVEDLLDVLYTFLMEVNDESPKA